MKNVVILFSFSITMFSSVFGQSKDSLGLFNEVLEYVNGNFVDSLGKKQGVWTEHRLLPSQILINELFPAEKDGEKVYISYDKKIYDEKSEIITCIGYYLNGLKTGIWKEYFSNDTLKSIIEYKNGIPSGKCNIYYKNGQVKIKCIIGIDFKIHVVGYDFNGLKIVDTLAEKGKLIKSIYED